MKISRTEKYGGYVMLTVMAAGILIPFLSLLLAAFNPPGASIGGIQWPSQWSWSNISHAWSQGHFSTLMWTSLKVELLTVPLALVCAALGGFALGAMRTPLRKVWGGLFLFGMTLPIEVVIVPLYFDLQNWHLSNSLITVALVESAAYMPFGVYWMRLHFASVPKELTESASIDGASSWQQFWRIHMPLARPALVTLGVLYFMWCWNQFLLILIIISDTNKRTAPAGLGYFVGNYSTQIPLLAAASLIVITPIVIVYLIFQRQFIAGMLQGAIK